MGGGISVDAEAEAEERPRAPRGVGNDSAGRFTVPRGPRNRVSVGMTLSIPKRRGRKRQLNLEVIGLEGPLGAPPPWERQLIESALAKMLDPKQAKAVEVRDETAP